MLRTLGGLLSPTAGGGGGGGFAPDDLAALGAWFRADSETYSNVAGTTPATNGQGVAFWGDLSGGGNHLTRTDDVAAMRPVLVTGAVNGHPVLDGDGSMSLHRTSLVTTATTRTMIAVARADALAGTQVILGHGDTAQLGAVDGQFASGYGEFDGGVSLTGHGAGAALSTATWYVLTSVFDGTDDRAYVNGALVNTRGDALSAIDTVFVAVGNDFTQFWNGQVAELLVYDRDLNGTERGQVHTYLGDRYAITMS